LHQETTQRMLKSITILIFGFFPLTVVNAQKTDSTRSIYTNLLMQLELSKTEVFYDDGDDEEDSIRVHKEDSTWFSTFHIKDKNLRKSLFSLTVKEYRNGIKLKEEDIFTKVPFEQSNLFNTAEDSSCVFSLFRKEIDSSTVKFGYGLPTNNLKIRTYKVSNISDYIIVEGASYFGIVPLDRPFTLFIYTSPDNTNNFPFHRGDNRRQIDPGKWSEIYKLRHSFSIDLTIHQLDLNKVEESSLAKKLSL